MAKAVVKTDTTKTTTKKDTQNTNKQAIQNINRTGTVSGQKSNVKGNTNVPKYNTDTSNLAGNNRQQALGTPKMTGSSKVNVLGKQSTRETGKTFVPETKTQTDPTTVTKLKQNQNTYNSMADESTRKANKLVNNVVGAVNNLKNQFIENMSTPTGRIELRANYKANRDQQKFDQVHQENEQKVATTTQEQFGEMFDNNGNRIDHSEEIKSLKNEIGQIDAMLNMVQDESLTSVQRTHREELQKRLDYLNDLDDRAQSFEEYYTYKQLEGSGDERLASYKEMLSHKNDNILERAGNALNHLGNTTTNIIPTAFEQMREVGTANYANENIAQLEEMHNSGQIDDATYVESLSQWQDYIDRYKSTNSDSMSQIIRANADRLSANTYYGASDIEKFCLQAGESTAQFLLHFALLGESATISMSLVSGTEKMNQLLMEGVDPQVAVQNGFMTGLVSYVTEKIGMDRFVNMMGTPFSSDAFGSIILNQLKGGLSEGLEEVAEGLVDPIIDSYTLGTPYEVNGNELLMEFFLGGASGLMMGVGATAIGTAQTAIEINNFLNERRDIRADVQNRIGELVVNSQYQKNLLRAEVNKLKIHYNSMTEAQKQVARELIAKGESSIQSYENKAQIQGVTFSSDIPNETTEAENNKAIYETYENDFNNELHFEQKLEDTENLLNDLIDSQVAVDTVNAQTQQILNENGYNIDSKVFNSLSPEQQNKSLVALDFARTMGLNVNVVNNLPAGQNGFVDRDNGSITIDGTKNPVLFTLTHELTHGTESSKYYPLLKKLVMDNYDGDWEQAKAQKQAEYKEGVNQDLSPEEAEQEIVARYVEDKLGDEKFIDDLIKYNFSLASRIYQNLKSMGSNEETDQIRNAFERAFKDNYEPVKGKYSISFNPNKTTVDADGEPISKGMAKYIDGTKLTNTVGDPYKIYHTSKSLFDVFDPTDTDYYKFGDKVVNYFSNNSIVSGSYTYDEFEQVTGEGYFKEHEAKKARVEELKKKATDAWSEQIEVTDKIEKEARDSVRTPEIRKVASEIQRIIDSNTGVFSNNEEPLILGMGSGWNQELLHQIDSRLDTIRGSYGPISQVQAVLDLKDMATIGKFWNEYTIAKEVRDLLSPIANLNTNYFQDILDRYDSETKRLSEAHRIASEEYHKAERELNNGIGKQYVGYGKALNPYILENESGIIINWNQINDSDWNMSPPVFETVSEEIGKALETMTEDDIDRLNTKNKINRFILDNVNHIIREYLAENPIALANYTNVIKAEIEDGFVFMGEVAEDFKRGYSNKNGFPYVSEYGDEYHFKGRLETNDVVKAVLAINDYIDNPYDGVVFRNMTDSGSWSATDVESDIIALFDSNQFKLLENENPTENKNINFSYNPESGRFESGNSTVDTLMNNIVDSMSEEEFQNYLKTGEFEYATQDEIEDDPEIQDEGLWLKDPDGEYIKVDDNYKSDGKTVAWKDNRIDALIKANEEGKLAEGQYKYFYALNLSPNDYRALSFIFEPTHDRIWRNEIQDDYYNNGEVIPERLGDEGSGRLGGNMFFKAESGSRYGTFKIKGQEGNHRAIMLDESGYSKMPIILATDRPLPSWVRLQGMDNPRAGVTNPNEKHFDFKDFTELKSDKRTRLLRKHGSLSNSDVQYSYENDKINKESTDEFRRLQEESESLLKESGWGGAERLHRFDDAGVRQRVSEVLRGELESRGYSDSDPNGCLKDTGDFKILKDVDGQTFHDFFNVARNYLPKGELVDLHPVETNEDWTGYNDTQNYLSSDGLSGFSITKDGDLISVFNASRKKGFLDAIAPFVKENAKTLDCYALDPKISGTNLPGLYNKYFGFEVSELVDYNMKYDHDGIAERYNKPQIAYMTNPNYKSDLEFTEKDMENYKMIRPVTDRKYNGDRNVDNSTGVVKPSAIINLESTIGKTTHEAEIQDGEEFAGYVAEQLDAGVDPESVIQELKDSPLDNGLIRAYYTAQVLADRGLTEEYKDVAQWARDIDNLGGKLIESTKILYNLDDSFSRAVYLSKVQDNLIAEYKAKYGKKNVDVDKIINDIFGKHFEDIINSKTVREFKKALGSLTREISTAMPKTTWDRIKQFRMLSMLSGTKTAISNAVANTASIGMYRLNDFNKAILENALKEINVERPDGSKTYTIDQSERNATLNKDSKVSKKNKAYAKEIWKQLGEEAKTKYGEETEKIPDIVKKNITIKNTKNRSALQRLVDTGFETAERVQTVMLNDAPFAKIAFVNKFNELAQVRGINLDTIDKSSKVYNKLIDDAYDYAEEVVSHNATDISNTLSNLQKHSSLNVKVNPDSFLKGVDETIKQIKEKSNKGQTAYRVLDKTLMKLQEWFVPFYKTNASVAMKAVQFSPIEWAQVRNDYDKVKSGDMRLVDMVDHMSKAMTGTALYTVGAIMGYLGYLKWDKDDEDYSGRLAIKIPGTKYGYTTDFIDPVSTIFAKGVVLAQELSENGVSWKTMQNLVDDYYDIFLNDEMDMFSNMKDFFDTIGKVRKGEDDYGEYTLEDGASDIGYSILNSYMPAIVRDVSRVFDPAKKVTYSSDAKKYLYNRLLNSTPFRSQLPDKKDATGNTMTYTQPFTKNDVFNRILTQMVSRGKLVDMEGNTVQGRTDESSLGEKAGEFNQMAQDFQFNDSNGDGYSDQHWIRDTVPTNIYPGGNQVSLEGEEKDEYGKTWTDTWTAGANYLSDNKVYQGLDYEKQADVVYELQAFARRCIEADYCKNNNMAMTDAQKKASAIKDFCTKNGKVDGEMLSLIALGTAKENKLANGGQQYVLAQKDENGKTVKNSRQLYMRQLYEQAGIYDDIIDAINKSEDLTYADFGLNKTVVEKYSEKQAKDKYSEAYGKVMSKSSSSKKSSKTAKKSSKKTGGSVGGKALAKAGAVKNSFKPSMNKIKTDKIKDNKFYNAYQNTMNKRKASSGSGGYITCPKCHNRVASGSSTCPICGTRLN